MQAITAKRVLIVATILFAALLSVVPFHAALAQTAPNLGNASPFAALGGTAVTLTDSAVIGDVGSPVAVTVTTSTVVGTVYPVPNDPIVVSAYADFLTAYALPLQACDVTLTGDLTGLVLSPGVYCVTAASTTTGGVLTLNGPSTGTWIFQIGTSGTGALTGTNFSVVMAGGGDPCNVYWWVAQAATLTDSDFVGTILAGTAITVTRGTFQGDALAKAAVTMTGAAVSVCGSDVPPPIDYCKLYCKQYCKDYCKDQDHCKNHDKKCKDYGKDKNHCKDYDKDHDKDHDKDNDKDHRDRR